MFVVVVVIVMGSARAPRQPVASIASLSVMSVMNESVSRRGEEKKEVGAQREKEARKRSSQSVVREGEGKRRASSRRYGRTLKPIAVLLLLFLFKRSIEANAAFELNDKSEQFTGE